LGLEIRSVRDHTIHEVVNSVAAVLALLSVQVFLFSLSTYGVEETLSPEPRGPAANTGWQAAKPASNTRPTWTGVAALAMLTSVQQKLESSISNSRCRWWADPPHNQGSDEQTVGRVA
jgi:hypothetical protein